MKRILPFVLALCSISAFAQVADLSHLMTRRLLSAEEITYNCKLLIPEYYYRAQDDSIKMLLDYWQEHAGPREEIIRTRTLLAIQDRTFNDDSVTVSFVKNMLSYKYNRPSSLSSGEMYFDYTPLYFDFFGNVAIRKASDEFDRFTRSLAAELMPSLHGNQIAYLICQFYTDEFTPLLTALRNNELKGTTLQQRYSEFANEQYESNSFNTAFFLEYWMPTQHARLLGNHPGVGFQAGPRSKSFQLDATIIFRFLNAANNYSVFADDSLYTTNHYSGLYLGLDAGRNLLRTPHSEIGLLGSVAYDAVTVIAADEEKEQDFVGVRSLNLNGGLGYRFYYTPYRNYVSIQTRFHVLDYNTRGGSDLTGNAFTIRLVWGFNRNYSRDRNLALLEPNRPISTRGKMPLR